MRTPLSNERKELIISLRKQGKSYEDIRKETDHALTTIASVLREAGLLTGKKRRTKVKVMKRRKVDPVRQVTLQETKPEAIIKPEPPSFIQSIGIKLCRFLGVTNQMYNSSI